MPTFQQFAAKIATYSTKIQTEVKELVEYHTGEIETQAIAAAPGAGDPIKVEGGTIRQDQIADKRRGNFVSISQAIGYEISMNGYKGVIYVERSAGEVAGYVEFGTGQSAKSYLSTVSPAWRSLAQRFYVTGTGTIIAQPYLLPAFMKEQVQFLKDLKKLVKTTRI